jgi:hypothetical protein
MRVRSFVAMAAVVLGLSGPTTALAASIAWDPLVTVTDVNTTLGLPGTVVSAATWASTTPIVVTDTFGSITFVRGGDVTGAISGPVTANSAGGGYSTGNFTGNTGNANFNAVLNGALFTGSGVGAGSLATISGLTLGQTYTIQLFALDDRIGGANPTIQQRTARFQDTVDGSGNNTATITFGLNQYALGTFVASGATQSFWEQGINSNNVIWNAAVVRLLPVPEPSAITLACFGLMGLVRMVRKQRQSA